MNFIEEMKARLGSIQDSKVVEKEKDEKEEDNCSNGVSYDFNLPNNGDVGIAEANKVLFNDNDITIFEALNLCYSGDCDMLETFKCLNGFSWDTSLEREEDYIESW